MHCPFCRHPDSRVIDSRTADDGAAIRRRRSCPECGRRFTTQETVILMVAKRSGVTEPFTRDKIIHGVQRACQGRPVSEDKLAILAQQVEETIRARGLAEVPSHEVGLAILGPLRDLDEVAYLRFASVYRGFESLADFEDEITALRQGRRDVAAMATRRPRPRPRRARHRRRKGGTRVVIVAEGHAGPGRDPGGSRKGDEMTETVSGTTTRKGKTAQAEPKRLTIGRIHTTPGVHPYDQVTWERRDVVMTNWRDGSVNFEQHGVEFPDFWSVNAANIVTTKYFRGAVGSPQREWSLKQLVDRVVDTYEQAGREHGYFATDQDAEIFGHELRYALVHQIFSFNSPVWFNVGTSSKAQVSACFILSVDDTMDAILDWYREEGLIFKGGSGAGVNLSKIRSSKELLSSGGTASGPVSFMRGADASAGTIKSGGATRRAAKMVVLDVDHPDVAEFIVTKAREEEKVRVLRDAGFDMDLGGKDIVSVQYQNANNSVRVSDEFMRAVEEGKGFDLLARRTGEVVERVDARKLMRTMAQAAWECADPGIQYDGTINDWHTCPESGRITASNPCSEYVHLDNSSCNLASINLLKFLRDDDTFDAKRFAKMTELIITAMDISICFADFPTEKISATTRAYRQLGIGYANLGALLMATGHAYDSEGGRAIAAAITSLMTGAAYKTSAELAAAVGPYDGYERNAKPHKRVIRKHADASENIRPVGTMEREILDLANQTWQECVELGGTNGYRNRPRRARHRRRKGGTRVVIVAARPCRAWQGSGWIPEGGRNDGDGERRDDPQGKGSPGRA